VQLQLQAETDGEQTPNLQTMSERVRQWLLANEQSKALQSPQKEG